MLIYFAGPVDFGGGDLEGRTAAFKELTDDGHIIYDATMSVKCNPDRLDAKGSQKAMDVHMTILRSADAMIAEFPSQTIGIAAELAEAHRFNPHMMKVALVKADAPTSLYLNGMCDIVTSRWGDVIQAFLDS